MVTEKFYGVLEHKSLLSITSRGIDEAYITNTWIVYFVVINH